MEPKINPALAQSAQDVPPDSSTGQGGAPNDHTQSADSPAPDAGNQSGDADSGDQQGQRTPDNVRGELLRKLDQQNQQWAERFARLEGMLSQPAQQDQQPSTPAQPRIEDMSSQQLEALRPQVPEDKRPELDRLIQQRKIDEHVAQRIDQRLDQQSKEQARVEANKTAYSRWPELRDPSSRLYQVTNQVLNERGNAVTADPRSLLDAANEAGMRMGLKPSAHQPSYGHHGVPHGSQPNQDSQPRGGMSKDEAAEIAARLQNAMPNGKFDLDRISERHGEYVEHKDLFIRQ